MGVGMAGHLVTRLDNRLGEVGVLAYVLANLEEGGLDVVLLEDVEVALGVDTRAVIEGDGDYLLAAVGRRHMERDDAVLHLLHRDVTGLTRDGTRALLDLAHLAPLRDVGQSPIGTLHLELWLDLGRRRGIVFGDVSTIAYRDVVVPGDTV